MPDIDGACVLARPLENPGCLRGELPEMRSRMLVPAVLAPHRAEHAELDKGGFPADQLDDPAVLVVAERNLSPLPFNYRHVGSPWGILSRIPAGPRFTSNVPHTSAIWVSFTDRHSHAGWTRRDSR